MVRLRYKKISPHEIKSETVISSKGITYFARINYEKGFWQIFNAKRRNVIKEGFSKNKNVLRRMVRRELQKLGINLEKEFKKESGYAKFRSGKDL